MRNSAKVAKRLMVRYPEAELQDLRTFLKSYGAKGSIKAETGICHQTITRVSKDGKGTHIVVCKLKDYVAALKAKGTI